jgi:hypothetical protein
MVRASRSAHRRFFQKKTGSWARQRIARTPAQINRFKT